MNSLEIKTKKRTHISRRTLRHTDSKIQNGGKFIGKGGFGCVVSPALKCSKKDKNTDMMVSKVIPTHDVHYSNELKISQVLKKIDPGKKYYLTFEKYCFDDGKCYQFLMLKSAEISDKYNLGIWKEVAKPLNED
jgi:hypothetical protein